MTFPVKLSVLLKEKKKSNLIQEKVLLEIF